MKRGLFFTVLVLVVSIFFIVTAWGQAVDNFSPYVDTEGNISVPLNYRSEWTFLGAWAVRDPEATGGIKEFHNVYTQPATVAAYQKSGKFPDGAVLVKELVKANSGTMTTGDVSWGTEVTGWFVMIKDLKDRFKGNKLWGDGWGWALFNSDNPSNTITKDYKNDCLACHLPAKKTDWIYSQGYSILAANHTDASTKKDDTVDGSAIFSKHCVACHAGGGNLIKPGKSLSLQDLESNGMDSFEKIVIQVSNGKPPMPAFKTDLSKAQIEAVASFVLKRAKSGW